MTGVGLEVLLEDLIPEIALSGDKGVPFNSLLKIVRQYHNSVNGQEEPCDGAAASSQALVQDGALEASFSEAEMKSAHWAWFWLRKQAQITISQDKDKRYRALELKDVLALPEPDDTPAEAAVGEADDAQQAPPPKPTAASRKNAKGKESKKTLTHRPRIFPTEELLWQTIAHHGVDYKRIPVLEWKCLVGIASSRYEGILQSDLRRLVDQDKRSLPKRTDSLAKKGYIAKRTIIANKMKTSKLWLLRFAPVEPENTKTKTGLDLAPETLTMSLDPVPWHVRWTGDGVDVEAHARTIVAIVKAWGVLRYCDLRSKMGVGGQTARMKTLAKACQRFVDMGVLKYTAAAFAGARKIFKDCLKFIREPTMDEWQEFLATGKKTSVYSDASRHRQPKSNALALTGKPGQNTANKNQGPVTTIRVFPGWSPDAPLTQFVFEVVRSAGATGASNPQVSIATIGYSFRRYMASLLAKLADANQPPHLKKFQVESKLVRSGKTSAYMFSVSKPQPLIENGESAPPDGSEEAQPPSANTPLGSRYGFGTIRAKAFPNGQELALSELCKPVKRPAAYQRRRGGKISESKRMPKDATSRSSASRTVESTPAPEVLPQQPIEPPPALTPAGAVAERERLAQIPIAGPPGAFIGEPGSLHPRGRGRRRPAHTIVVVIRLQKLKDPSFWESLQPKPVDVGALDVRFDGIAGKLELDPAGESVKFVGIGGSEGAPLIVRIDNLMGNPFIQDDPTSSDKSLVLVTTTTSEQDLSRTLAFHFDNDEKTLGKVLAFQQRISDKKPVAIAPPPTPTTASPARGGARGGRGGRAGRGGAKGRGGKKGQAGGAVWKCDKCGGTWKNDIGLKYHLTKAQNPCNPDFDPASLLEKARKRRQATLAPPLAANPAVGSTTSHHELSEFKPSYSYDRILSESKKRTAQAADIIQYLLNNNDGVFPGDKALFYALTKVFLREFLGEVPPTWKNFHAAMRILESQKLAMVHTHMLHENGRRHACTMFVRTGVDPNGPIPTAMRQKMKEVYPSIYIPPAFSPTMEELALLEELDKKPEERAAGDKEVKQNRNGNKFRSRRKIDEVEVFNAPYYTRTMQAEPTPPPMDTNSYFVNHNPLPTKDSELTPSPGTSRKRPLAAEPPAESPTAKKQRQHYNKALDLNIDPASLPGTGIMSTEPRSVVDAIKTYGLLPSRTGRRKRRDSMAGSGNMGKIPSELGWAKNPGLSSLPLSFWGNMDPFGGRPRESRASVRFLAPNTHLGDEIGGEGACGEEDRPPVATNNKPPAEVLPIDPALVNVGEADGQETKACVFVNPTELGDSAPGTWSGLDLRYFELNQEASFALKGWMPDRVKLLLENLPKSAEEMGKRNRGQPWKITDSWLDQEWARFWLSVSRIKTWELSQHGSNLLLLGGSIAPEHIYINVSPSIERSNMQPMDLQWSEGTQYTLDTLPYEYLDDDDDMDDISYVARMPNRKVGRPKKVVEPKQRKRQRIAKVTEKTMGMVRGSKFKLPAIKTGRELTAFPRSEEDFLRVPGDDSLQLDWTSENVKLTAFVVITTLLGGVDRIVDWGLMLRLFPDLTISQLRHLWGDLKKDRQSTIVNLTEKFRKAFLRAYKNEELPPLDFNNTAAYDWKSLIKWALKLDNTQRADIPASREEVQTKYTLDDCQYANREWRESYYHPQRSVFNRFQDASSDALACPAESAPTPAPDTDMLLALSWTRSLCVTPIDTYPTDMVIKRRESLYPRLRRADVTELIMKGIEQLQKEGIISRSTSKFSNGRRWRFNNRVPDLLEKVAQVDKLTKAVAYKRELDAAFRSNDKKRVTYITNDGMMLALLNMQACGRVRLETTGQPHVPLGHEPGNYETRKYTKKYMHFRLDVVPTDTYLFDDEPQLAGFRDRLRAAEPPSEGPGGAIPVWCDVFGKVDGGRWLRYLAAVLLTLASRGSMRADELVKTLKPTIMLFEAELILGWAAALDCLEPQMEGLAPAVKEWWWMVLEAQQERLNNAGRPRKMLPGGRRPEGRGEEGLY
ncbi:hypothetical protein QBC39DRAFT_313084 [Podospora conica]|nr:hypothetical protein QBC39DRAFT_313084 [Schizothecium conicum]